MASDFRTLGVEALRAGFANGTLDPVEVAERCIERVTRLDPGVRAWVSFDADLLRARAAESAVRLAQGAARGPLEGVPVGVKDIFNTIDFATQMGSPLWKDFTAGNDARAVYHLHRAGALVPGKTATAEFAVHTLAETRNPFDETRTPGTSSSGSAVAVASGMVPAALGTQTAGSIVRPASFCGVYGFKPSFGLIPRTGMLKTTDTLDTIGFFVSRCEDLAVMWDVMRLHGPDYPFGHTAFADEERQNKPTSRPWRVGLARTHTWNEAFDYAREAMEEWVGRVAAHDAFEIVELDLPTVMAEAHEVHATIYDTTLAHYFQEEYKQQQLVSPIMNELIRRGRAVSPAEYRAALERQKVMVQAMKHVFADVDVLVSLATAGIAPLREERERPDSGLMWTMTHLPVISAPTFRGPAELPFGLQLVARRYNDPLLLRFAAELAASELIPAGAHPRAAVPA